MKSSFNKAVHEYREELKIYYQRAFKRLNKALGVEAAKEAKAAKAKAVKAAAAVKAVKKAKVVKARQSKQRQ